MPAASAAMRSRATSSSRSTGAGSAPKRSMSSARIVVDLRLGRRPAQPPVQLQLLRLLGDVVVGQIGVDRQVDDRLGARLDRLTVLEIGLLLLDRLGEQLRVEVEADGRQVAVLLPAEDVAGAADLEVGQRDLEPGAQLGRVEDGLQPLAGNLRQLAAACRYSRYA